MAESHGFETTVGSCLVYICKRRQNVVIVTYMYTYIPWIQKFSRMTVECGVRYKHNNIKSMQNTQRYYTTEYYQYFICSIMRNF